MFKKALKIVVTFAVLVGAYQAYLLAFAVLTDRIGDRKPKAAPFVWHEGRVAKQARELAASSFGEGHWSTNKDLNIRFYDAERGFFMYAGNYERKEKGKKLEFWPFAIVWLSKDGRSRKTATSARALVELSEPLGLVKTGASSMHVVEARLEQDVTLRDDKGTADPSDDLIVDGGSGPLPYIEYTEKVSPAEIRTKSTVRIVDQKLTLTGFDLLILLRKPQTAVAGASASASSGSGSGFDAETAILRRDIRINVLDVGKSGVMPGPSRGKGEGGPTPVTLKADGEMRIDLPVKPRPLLPYEEGPPQMEGPTFANFRRNVEVARGVESPDTLNSDALRLTLLPSEPRRDVSPLPGGGVIVIGAACFAPGGGGSTPRAAVGASDNPLGGLELRQADATGFAVWLASESQGVVARCNELIYKKLLPDAPDETYLRADPGSRVSIEKVDRDGTPAAPGPIRGVTNILVADAKVLDDGTGGSASTIIARGSGARGGKPGQLESRPTREASVEHSATWTDELVLKTFPLSPAQLAEVAPSMAPGQAAPTRREVTLTGDPVLIDHAQEMTLSSRSSVFASLLPNTKGSAAPKPAPGSKAGPGGALGGSMRIERVEARDRVRLTTPGRTILARDALNAPFEEVVALAQAGPAPTGPAPAPVARPEPDPDDATRKPAPEPAVLVAGHRIWAKIRRLPDGKTELAEARLRGAVEVHQDPSPGKPRGTHASGDALDLLGVGPGLMKLKLLNTDPSAVAAAPRLAAREGVKVPVVTLAAIDTDDYSIRGPLIGLDQSRDFAWVVGPGSMTQLAERGFLNDKGLRDRAESLARLTPEERKREQSKKAPLTIGWTESMRFYGHAKDPKGRPAALAEFRGGVDAKSEDYRIVADEMDTYTDRPVSLVQKKAPASANPDDVPAPSDEPKADLALLLARNRKPWKPGTDAQGVTVLNVRRDEATGAVVERQAIEGPRLSYDRRTGDYYVPGPGIVRLYRRSALKPGEAKPAEPEAEAVASTKVKSKAKAKADPKAKAFGPWELTKVAFADEMVGRFGAARDEAEPEPRTADFYGRVAAVTGPVRNEAADIDFDRRPPGARYLTSARLRIYDEPPPRGVKDAAAHQIITADGGNAQAHDDTSNIAADHLHYDTAKGLFYAYGEADRLVTLTRQSSPGQPASMTKSDALLYNTKTKDAEPINPLSFFLVDAKGIRFKAAPAAVAPGPEGPAKRVRAPLRPPGRMDIERRGYVGS